MMMKTDSRMELLSPAGSFESLKTAVLYGANAVYLGGEMYGLRAKARNFGKEELAQAVADHLEDLGYVKAQDPEPYRKPGRPSKSKYTVYPELLRQGQTGA